MKNKKGFTLIELLAVIVILAIILVIATTSVIKSINSSKEKTRYTAAKDIVDIAKAYMETNSITEGCVSVKDMINDGYLKTDSTNPFTGENKIEEDAYVCKDNSYKTQKDYVLKEQLGTKYYMFDRYSYQSTKNKLEEELPVAEDSYFTWRDKTVVTGLTDAGREWLKENGGILVFPEKTTEIGSYAFKNNSNIKKIVFNKNITKIGYSSFSGCTSISGDLIIPNSVTHIEDNAFNGCTGFDGKLILSNQLKIIGKYAFENCSNLTGDLIIPNSVTDIGAFAFQNCKGFNGKLTLSDKVNIIESATFKNCTGLTGDLIIPNSVTKIESSAFTSCSNFTSLKLSNNLIEIADGRNGLGFITGAFEGCSGLTGELYIPDSITKIGIRAFKNCGGLTSISYPSKASVGTDAFTGCVKPTIR